MTNALVPVQPEVTRALVVIPAHNEEDFIAECLTSVIISSEVAKNLWAQRGRSLRVEIIVVADSCTDATVEIIASFAPRCRVVAASCRRVGAARDKGVVEGIELLGGLADGDIWVFNTDADSCVAPEWIAFHLDRARTTDAIKGTVCPRWRSDELTDVIASYNMLYDDHDGHSHTHGANMSFSARAYLSVGGFPLVAESEDVGLMHRFWEDGLTVASLASFPVMTSTRESTRTPGGFSGYVHDLKTGLLELDETV